MELCRPILHWDIVLRLYTSKCVDSPPVFQIFWFMWPLYVSEGTNMFSNVILCKHVISLVYNNVSEHRNIFMLNGV